MPPLLSITSASTAGAAADTELGGSGSGSANMTGPCYSNPTDSACANFTRSDQGESRKLGTLGFKEEMLCCI